VNGRKAKLERRLGLRSLSPAIEIVSDGDVKPFDKSLYWERRNKGLNGHVRHANVVEFTEDEEGNARIMPVRLVNDPQKRKNAKMKR
jgi:hypothetical protein